MAKVLLLLFSFVTLFHVSLQQGPECSATQLCPIGCCSKSGYCGTGPDFCGLRPSCSVSDTPITRVIGYYEAWSTTNRPCYNMLPEKILFGYYTDLIFSFLTIGPKTFEIKAVDTQTAEFMQRIGAIKLIQPDIRIWIASFIDSLIKMMNQYGFDGIDIDWEYPAADDRFGKEADFKSFVTFMKSLGQRMHFFDQKKLVSLTLSSSFWYLQHFDLKELQKHVDWFNVMSYDLHGSWDIHNKFTGPYADSHTNMTEIQDALDLIWRNDVPPEKVTFGMFFYSRSFTLQNAGCNTPGCVVSSGGNAGECSGTTGVLLHPEIADIVSKNNLSPTLHRDAAVKSVSWGDQWTTFDDLATWRLKANIIRGQCIPGVMVWAMSQDNKDNSTIISLTSALGRKAMDPPKFVPAEPVEQPPKVAELCRWSGCYQDCPAGFKTVQRDGHEEIMLTSENCLDGCESGKVKVGSLRVGCNFSHQAACCTDVASTTSYGMCKWVGESPTCDQDCPSDYPNKIFSSQMAGGGEQPCISGTKNYCCQEPKPAAFDKCDWVDKGNPPSCLSGQIKLSSEVGGLAQDNDCMGGARAYCCEPAQVLKPRGDDDPFGGKQNKEFQLLLEAYAKNPTCSATILHLSEGNMFGNTITKRNLQAEAAHYRFLNGRATDCESDRFDRMILFAALLLTTTESLLEPLSLVYDDLFAGGYDEELMTTNIRNYYAERPEIDPNALIRYVFINQTASGPGLRRARRAETTFCELIPTAKRAERGVAGNSKNNGETGQPDMSTILEGILSGDLSLHYARWQHIDNQGGPMLELAYWIGRTPGVPEGSDFDRFRDEWEHEEERWVVFHFHVNQDIDWVAHVDGRTRVGVQALRVFHGYESNEVPGSGQAWRVDNTGSNSERDGFSCPDDQLWWVGSERDLPTDQFEFDMVFFERFQQWGRVLFDDGYLATRGLDLIFTNQGGSRVNNNGNEDLNPDNQGLLLRGGRAHPGFGVIMQDVNFLINDYGYNFRPIDPDA
ncbi:hypothetical protein BDP81DRAFT_485358 [Colletotrichum phormii]|uniref:chitinase n=1 Tax=Colletotrichum phormii TaxID=359342 RepID=A0AAI9ZDK9_9PEZI|nr:uncharacterized protein BDP81DRAFT_485358 [Colletotrichum phormii]KAK1622587.1 hypothetical protein BDP81DRAFT_485358 [Colletotrichum phormii]